MTTITIIVAINIILLAILYQSRKKRNDNDFLYFFGIIKAEWEAKYSIITVWFFYDGKKLEADLLVSKSDDDTVYLDIDAVYDKGEEIELSPLSLQYLNDRLTDVEIIDKYVDLLHTDIINEI